MVNLFKRSDVAVLFVLIGWAQRYDGTESIIGGHSYQNNNPGSNTEMAAFVSDSKGYYCCGIDGGNVDEPSLDVVFVARNVEHDNYATMGSSNR